MTVGLVTGGGGRADGGQRGDRGRVRQIGRDVLGLAVLRPAQVEAAAALAAGRDCLVVLPSGAGKSAIYQIAAVALEGPVIVISPLLALQREQADALRARGLNAVTVNGLSGRPARRDADALLDSGRTGFIFLGPEQLARDDVRASLTRAPVRMVAVDEAHCIASWGHDFRPDYLRLGAVIEAFPARPVVAALTATAAPPVRREITERLGLHDPRQVIRDFDRPEIHLTVRAFHRAEDKRQAVLAAVRDQPGSGLVYAATRKEAEAYAALLGVRHYHGGLAKAERRSAQQAFESGATIVATSAFGMGMDRADVRFVVHASVSGSLDEYYQEIGRGGRDGQPAAAICCYRAEDLGMFRSFVAGLPDHGDLAAVARRAGPAAGPARARRPGGDAAGTAGRTAQSAGGGRGGPARPPGRAGRLGAGPGRGRRPGRRAGQAAPFGGAVPGRDDAQVRRDDRLPPPVPAAVLRRGGIAGLRGVR